MTLRVLLSSILAVVAAASLVAQEIYVLKYEPRSREAAVVQIGDEGVELRRVLSLPKPNALENGWGNDLEAVEDRLVLQGPHTAEIDSATGRILRRYDSLSATILEDDREINRWAFVGTAVTPAEGDAVGITPGIYGSLRCAGDNGGHVRLLCGRLGHPFAGTDPNEYPEYRFPFLLRRSLDPSDTTLQEVIALPATTGEYEFTNPGVFAFDPWRGGFWRVVRAVRKPLSDASSEQWSFFPITDGRIGPEQVRWVLDDTDRNRWPADLAVTEDRLLVTFQTNGGGRELYSRSLSDGSERLIKKDVVSVAVTRPRIGKIATQLVPAVGRTPGANGTQWRSDLWIFNPDNQPISFRLRRVTRPDEWHEYELGPHASFAINDVLGALGGGPMSEGGDGVTTDALLVEAPHREHAQLSIYTRTWTPSRASGEDEGTYGQATPALPSAYGHTNHAAEFRPYLGTSTAHFVLDRRDPARFRHNVGVVNTRSTAMTVRLSYFFTDASIGDPYYREFQVAPHTVVNVSLEGLFGQFLGLELIPAVINVAASQPAAIWLSMVDNKTGDATFIPYTNFTTEPQIGQTMAIPAVAQTPGALGTLWRTDLYGILRQSRLSVPGIPAFVYESSPCSATGTAKIEYLPEGLLVQEEIGRLFSKCSAFRGAVEFESGTWLGTWSRTYTTRNSDGGTFGDMLPLYPKGGWRIQHFSGITVNAATRINIGLYNGADHATPHRLRLFDERGNLAAETTLVLTGRELRQESIQHLLGRELPTGLYGLTVEPQDTSQGAGRSWAYVARVDNVTGDLTNWW
jgi:hypothetical protein